MKEKTQILHFCADLMCTKSSSKSIASVSCRGDGTKDPEEIWVEQESVIGIFQAFFSGLENKILVFT